MCPIAKYNFKTVIVNSRRKQHWSLMNKQLVLNKRQTVLMDIWPGKTVQSLYTKKRDKTNFESITKTN